MKIQQLELISQIGFEIENIDNIFINVCNPIFKNKFYFTGNGDGKKFVLDKFG